MCLYDILLFLVPCAALSRCAEYYFTALLPHFVYEYLEVILEVEPCSCSRCLLFLVVMSELTYDIITLLQRCQNFLQSVSSEERPSSQPAFRMVRDSHLLSEPSCYHLPPRCVWLVLLVHHCRVATEVDSADIVGWINLYRGNGGVLAAELQCQSVVPVQVVMLARFQFYPHLLAYIWRAFVHDECEYLLLFFSRHTVFYHEAS